MWINNFIVTSIGRWTATGFWVSLRHPVGALPGNSETQSVFIKSVWSDVPFATIKGLCSPSPTDSNDSLCSVMVFLLPCTWSCHGQKVRKDSENVPALPSRYGQQRTLLFFFFFFLINLFIYFWLQWAFIAARGLSLVAVSRGYSLLRCMGFSTRWLLLLWSTGSRCMGFSSCSG